jgi:hypothetical protein
LFLSLDRSRLDRYDKREAGSFTSTDSRTFAVGFAVTQI